MVRQDRTRRHRPWRFYLSSGSEEKAHAIHPPVQQATQAREVEVLRHRATNYSRFNCYSPLVCCPTNSRPKTRRESAPCCVANPRQVCAPERGAGAPLGMRPRRCVQERGVSRCACIPLPGRIPTSGTPAPPSAGAPRSGSRLAWRRFRRFSNRCWC